MVHIGVASTMIRLFRANNYGCLVDVEAPLTPLHAFVGPNDSGKSTLLHGLRTVVQLASKEFADQDRPLPFDPFLPTRSPSGLATEEGREVRLACAVDGGWYSCAVRAEGLVEKFGPGTAEFPSGGHPYRTARRLLTEPSVALDTQNPTAAAIRRQLSAARLVRLDPDALRRPCGLIPETAPIDFLDDRGHGLAGVYFALRNRDDGAFLGITEEVRRLFPTVQSFRVKAVSSSEVVLESTLVNGARVEAGRLSEGLLYYLAFAALRHLDAASLLLVEEPENGLHPARVAEVVEVLRAIADAGTQVVMATHSPLVINELLPEEVSIVTRALDKGTKVTPIKDTPNFGLRTKAYALGELWLSYANGVDEGPLLDGGPRP